MSYSIDALPARGRPALILNSLVFTLLISLPVPLPAAGQPPFDQWNVNQGTIDASAGCNAPGVTCTVLAQDQGMLQQKVTTPGGNYIQLIVTEADATGNAATLAFVSENFISEAGLTAYDINSQQIIRDPAHGFEQRATISREPFYDTAGTLVDLLHVDLQQTLNDSVIDTAFHLDKHEATLDTGEVYSGKGIDISQNLVTASASSPDGIRMAFDARSREGWKLSNVDQALSFDPFAPSGEITLGGGKLGGTSSPDQHLSWMDGDSVTTLWLSQLNDELVTGAFGFQRIDNHSDNTSIKAGRLDTSAIIDPFAWDELTFGQAPTLP